MNCLFIWKTSLQIQDILKDGKFLNDCCRPWTKTRFKNSCSRQFRSVNAVVSRSPAGQIDWPKSVFLQDKVLETMMTTMNEVNKDKTKVADYFFPLMFCLTVLLLNSVNKLIHNRWTCKLIIKALRVRLHTCIQMNNCVLVFMFYLLFSVLQFWNYTKTIIRLSPSTSSRGLFDNIHFAFGE